MGVYMALSPLALEIIKLIGTAASGGLILEIARWLLGKRSKDISDASELGKAWKELVNEFQEERTALRAQISELKEWEATVTEQITELTEEAKKRHLQIAHLQHEREVQAMRIANLQGRNTALERRVEILEQENGILRTHNAELMIQLARCLERQDEQQKG